MIKLSNSNLNTNTDAPVDQFRAIIASALVILATAKGRFKTAHPLLAFKSFLSWLGNEENKPERQAMVDALMAKGVSEADAKAQAGKAIRSTIENGRAEAAILARINGVTIKRDGKTIAKPIVLTPAQIDHVAKLIRRSGVTAPFGTIELEQMLNEASQLFANVKGSLYTAKELGFEAGLPTDGATEIPAELLAPKGKTVPAATA